MSELVLATVVSELKLSWGETIADPDLITLLYDAVAEPIDLKNQNGDPITVPKGTASKIMNRTKGGNPNRDIRKHSKDQAVLDSIEGFFQRNVVKRLLKDSEDDLIHRLRNVIENDRQISDAKRDELLALAQKKTLASFLASVYLYSLSRKNVIGQKKPAGRGTQTDVDERKRHPLPAEEPSVHLKTKERPYADALMKVYGEITGVEHFTIKILDTYPDQKEHFVRQRKDYLAAEAVRRGTRDVYGDDEEKEYFGIFLKEIYNGVIDVYDSPRFKTGYERLEAVLIEAKNTPVNQCWLSRDTVWIGNSQKKGVCHILVNENVLKGWVREDAKNIQQQV